MKDSDFKR